MAQFTQSTAGSLVSDDGRVADYLYELNENLSYMFNNLTPEDNYSEDARLTYVQRGKRIGYLEVRADKIELRVQDDENNYNTSMQLFANLLKLTANTPEGSSTIAMTGDKIELTTGKFIVNSKNLTIDAAGNATFSGTVRAATIIGGTITGTNINGGDTIRFKARPSYIQVGDFEVNDDYDRHVFESYDEVTGMSTGDASPTQYLLWAGWNGSSSTFGVNNNGVVYIDGDLYIDGTLYYNGQSLRSYIQSIAGNSSSGGGGGSSPGGTPSGGDSGGPTGDENDPLLGG
jgi:hypothetical protein